MNKTALMITRATLIIIGIIISVDAITLIFTANLHVGHFLTLAAGVSLVFLGAFLKKLPTWIIVLYAVVAICTLIFCSVLVLYGSQDTTSYNEDAVIILGAGIHREAPGQTLTGRLDTSLEYYKRNSDVVLIVSGGQGPQEDITEAEAMARYLIAGGVDPNNIILEENATSSRENFAFSKSLLDEYFDSEYSVVFITNEYHVYRAEFTAKEEGYTSLSHLHSRTSLYTLIPNLLRECLAIVKTWVS